MLMICRRTPIAKNSEWKNPDWYCHGILDGTLPSDLVYENQHAVAFRAPKGHRNKKYDCHVIVIPRRHVETLLDIGPSDGELLAGLMDAIHGAAQALVLDKRGFFVRANVLPPYQGTGHIHVHLLSGRRAKKA
jgi:histidine triad (HIT) family protein